MWDWIGKLADLKKEGVSVAIVTVSASTGSTPREVGAKMLVTGDGKIFGTVGGGKLESLARDDAKKILDEGTTKSVHYDLTEEHDHRCCGTAELLFEVMNVGPHLYIFGAGHVGQAVSRTMQGTPFTVHLIDERDEWVNSADIPGAAIRHQCRWQDFVRDAKWDAGRTFVAIMTHGHRFDQQILMDVMKRPLKYLGMIGSRSKWALVQKDLREAGYTDRDIAKVHCPIGLPVGGKSPQEVAISLAAELLQVFHGT